MLPKNLFIYLFIYFFMFKTFWVSGQLWFQGGDVNNNPDASYCFPVSMIQLNTDRSLCYFKSNSMYSFDPSGSSNYTSRGSSIPVSLSSLPTYSTKLTDKENFDEYIKFLFRNY